MSDKPRVLGTPARATPVQEIAPPALKTETLDDDRVIQVAPAERAADLPGELYTPAADVHETTADGRTIQIAAKGTPIPMAQARQLGLVKDAPAARHETKDA